MSAIEVVYEKGVFRPLKPVELPEGTAGAVVLVESQDAPLASDSASDGTPVGAQKSQGPVANDDSESPGGRAYRLLMEIAALPHTAPPDGRTDISVEHDSILYPKQGRMP